MKLASAIAIAVGMNRVSTADAEGQRNDIFFVKQDESESVNLSELAESNYKMIDENVTGTDALKIGLLQKDENGFLCAQVVIKGNEKFHTHESADLFVHVMSGGGYFNVGNGTSIPMPAGSNMLVEAGQPHQFFNKADPYTAVVACFQPTDNSGENPVDASPGPDLDLVVDSPPVFLTLTEKVDLMTLEGPGEGESRKVHVLQSTTGISGMTVAAVVLATEETYHVHDESSLLIIVIQGNVVTASANNVSCSLD